MSEEISVVAYLIEGAGHKKVYEQRQDWAYKEYGPYSRIAYTVDDLMTVAQHKRIVDDPFRLARHSKRLVEQLREERDHLRAERDQLRAELAAIRASEPVGEIALSDDGYKIGLLSSLRHHRIPLGTKIFVTQQPQPDVQALEARNAELVEALEHARLFISNGVELGYITMPDADTPDPAHDTLPIIRAALTQQEETQ